MFGRRRAAPPTPQVERYGDRALVVCLHGYGADEQQFTTLAPTALPVTRVALPGPELVESGRGWWLPEAEGAALELAPDAAVEAAVTIVVEAIEHWHRRTRHTPATTALLGYSQGAVLALTVAARRPDLVGALATAAGALLPAEIPDEPATPLEVLVMNGTLDPVVTAADHRSTVARFAAVGHRVVDRLDRVPHVLDLAQAYAIEDHLAGWMRLPPPAGTAPAPAQG